MDCECRRLFGLAQSQVRIDCADGTALRAGVLPAGELPRKEADCAIAFGRTDARETQAAARVWNGSGLGRTASEACEFGCGWVCDSCEHGVRRTKVHGCTAAVLDSEKSKGEPAHTWRRSSREAMDRCL